MQLAMVFGCFVLLMGTNLLWLNGLAVREVHRLRHSYWLSRCRGLGLS